jgi:hypothetical protein
VKQKKMDVIVEYEYKAQNIDELNIKKGDRLRNVVAKEEGWFEGELLNGTRGFFPSNFVKVLKGQSKTVTSPSSISNNQSNVLTNNNGIMKTLPLNSSNLKQSDLISESTNNNSNEKPLKKQTNFNNTVPSNWQRGNQINGSKVLNHIDVLKQPHHHHHQQQQQQQQPVYSPNLPTSQNHDQNNSKGLNNIKKSPPMPAPKPKASSSEQFDAKVLYSYIPVNEDELAIQENEIVHVVRLVEDGWYEGIYAGQQGVFPSNYVEKLITSTTPDNNNTINGVISNESNESLNSNSNSLIENTAPHFNDGKYLTKRKQQQQKQKLNK